MQTSQVSFQSSNVERVRRTRTACASETPVQQDRVAASPTVAMAPTRAQVAAAATPSVVELPSHASQSAAVTDMIAGSTTPLPHCTYVILGATGDLMERHAGRDALIYLAEHDILNAQDDPVMLFGGSPVPFEQYVTDFKNGGPDSPHMSEHEFQKWLALASASKDAQGNLPAASIADVADFKAINDRLGPDGNAVIYGAIPARLTMKFLTRCKDSGLADAKDGVFRRIVLEKPFGRNAAEAQELAGYIQQNFQPGQVLLVDHFMGKPGLLNWIAAKTDPDVEAALSNAHVDGMTVILDEKVLSNERPYFRETGELGDMANHALSLFATVASTFPTAESLNGDAIRQARADVLEHTRVDLKSTLRGQCAQFNDPKYGAPVGADQKVKLSDAESFAAFKLEVDTPRWKGVPVQVRLSKGVAKKYTGIEAHLHSLPPGLAQRMGVGNDTAATMRFEIAPEVRISIKPDGSDTTWVMAEDARIQNLPPYARLDMDAIRGNNALYIDKQESISVWQRIMDPVHQFWTSTGTAPMFHYPLGADAAELVRYH